MPLYEIEQYEIHAQTYRVHAHSQAEAIRMLFSGEAAAVDGGLDLIEVCDTMGLPVSDHAALAAELARSNGSLPGDVIPSIRSIQEVDEE